MNILEKLFGKRSQVETPTENVNASENNAPKQEEITEESNLEFKKESEDEKAPKANGKAHIYNLIIVDESGSMSHLKEATLSGINETINTIKGAQKEHADTQEHTLTLVTFDTANFRPPVRGIIVNEPIDKVGTFSDYYPHGCTPLYDALGISLSKLHLHIKDDPDATGVVTVLTDGLENSSRQWTAYELSKLIDMLKEKGWSFSYMGSAHNVKHVSDMLNIDNVVEFSHDQLGADSTWKRERASRMAYYGKMDKLYSLSESMSESEMVSRKKRFAQEYYGPRVTPGNIETLGAGQVFVFGSNAQGHHQGGAAALALKKFGAVMGQGEGLQGRSYAIPTTDGLPVMREAVKRFIDFARKNPEITFFVTAIGCGNAGYTPDQVAPLFSECIELENVYLPSDFWKVLGLRMEF